MKDIFTFYLLLVLGIAFFLSVLGAFEPSSTTVTTENRGTENKTVTNEKKKPKNVSNSTAVATENPGTENASKNATVATENLLPLACKYTTADEGGVIKDWHSINAYPSLAEAQKNPLHAPAEYNLSIMSDKKVKIFYEKYGKIKKLKPENEIFTLRNLGSDLSQSEYILEIKYNKDSYFLYLYTREDLKVANIETSECYLSVVSLDEYCTVSPIKPVKFYDTKVEAISNPISLQRGYVDFVFYNTSGNDFDIKIISDVYKKPEKIKVYRTEGKLAVYTFEELGSEFGSSSSYSYLVEQKMPNGHCKYLQIYITIGNN